MAKVLLVEDDNNLREIYQARLAAEGYEISSAQDGEEALVVAKQEKPDLVISDVMMPKISGFEMLDILRNTPGLEHVKVIMLTALGQSEDRDRADSLGADKYLVKSQVTLEDIVKTAHQLLDGDTADASAVSATAADTPVAAAPAEPVAQTDASTTTAAATDTPAPSSGTPDPAAVTADPVTAVPADDPADPVQPVPAPQTPTDAQPSGGVAQEAAVVQEQINSFVQEAPAEAPAEVAAEPVAEAPAEPTAAEAEPAAETPVDPVAAEPVAATAAPENGDDQLMAAAANELATSSDTPAAEPVAEAPAEPTAAEAEPAAETPVDPVAAEPAAGSDKTPDISSSTTIAGKKIIQPLDSEPKPSIHELLAKEEAAQTGATGPAVSSEPPAAEEKKPDNGGLDPNSVAL